MSVQTGRSTGTLATWNDERGFGFISAADGSRVFAHISAFPARAARPQLGESLTFEVERGADGKRRARGIRYSSQGGRSPAAAKPQQPNARRNSRSAGAGNYLVIIAFVALALYINAINPIPLWIVVVYVLASVACFAVYAFDKSAAKNGRWRVPENTLHVLALIGGWPGAICAQQMLRHKTQKTSFRVVFWLTVVANVVAFVTFATLAQ